jgi:methylglyoxal synthase
MKVKVRNSLTLDELQELDLASTIKGGGELIIGRSPDSDLVLDNPDVSRVHAKFTFSAGNYYFWDLGSRNGSVINGKVAEKNERYALKDGDIITIGDYLLMVEQVTPLAEQLPETVFRSIDPALLSGKRTAQNVEQPQIANPPEVINEVPEPVINQSVASETPATEELSQTTDEVESHEVASSLQEDIQQIPEIATSEGEVGEVTPFVTSEIDDSVTPEVDESTIVQPRDNVVPIAESSETEEDLLVREYTVVQPRDIISEPEAISISQKAETPEVETSQAPVVEESTFVQPRDIVSPQPEAVSISQEAETSEVETPAPNIVEEEPLEDIVEAPQEVSETQQLTTQANQVETPEVESVVSQEATTEKEISITSESELLTEAPEASQTIEEEQQPQSQEISTPPEVLIEAPEASQTIEEEQQPQSQEISTPTSVSEDAQINTQKHIVLIAHETKKSELVELIAEHKEFFSQCFILSWQSISETLHQQLGINISQQIPAATSGGYQTIASLVGSGEILAVIFIRDYLQPQPGQANEEAFLRLCNINQVLLATNIPTAKAIVHYIQNITQ